MGILRKDYLLDRWVFYATARKNRRMEFKAQPETVVNKGTCFFCPGNEKLTPPEIGRVEYQNDWKIRWFPNKFPAVELKGNPKIKTKNRFFSEAKNYGAHEVIVETREHEKELWDLDVEHIKEIFEVYILRIKALSKLKGVKYVVVFKNHGSNAGTSLVHSHTQIATMPVLPKEVVDEIDASKGKCPYCKIIKLEAKSKRKIVENKSVVAFAPFASRFNFEAWIFPKRHVKNITDMDEKELYDMASALKKILLKLKELNASYNFYLHYAPAGYDLHFHIEIIPRLAKWGGFEYSSGAVINSVLPEDAASFYRRK